MKKEYRIVDRAATPTDAEIDRYADFGKLVYNHERMTKPLYKRPLYKDPRAFLVVLLIVLVAILVAEAVDSENTSPEAPTPQRLAP